MSTMIAGALVIILIEVAVVYQKLMTLTSNVNKLNQNVMEVKSMLKKLGA